METNSVARIEKNKAGERTHANAYGFADDLSGVSLHWNEDMRELTIKSAHKIGLPFGDKIRALVASREQSPSVISAASELLKHLRHLCYVCEATAPHIMTNEARVVISKAEAV